MSVRGRSRTYTFADVFDDVYENTIQTILQNKFQDDPNPFNFTFEQALNKLFYQISLRDRDSKNRYVPPTPNYSKIQDIFTRNCVECHGGLNGDMGYRPFTTLNLSEGMSYNNILPN